MAGGAELEALLGEAQTAIAGADTAQLLREVRARFLGRKGSIAVLLRGIGQLPADERGPVGAAINAAKERVESACDARMEAIERGARETSLATHQLDVTLPGEPAPIGRLHPMTYIEREVFAFFTSMGFEIETGPQVETDWNNFGALNFPDDHPARDAHDTFYVDGGHLLRTHTSPVQIRAMTGRTPPLRFIAPGRVYRTDYDTTHSPMFHQIEGFIVDDHTTLADLKGVLFAFARALFGKDVKLRFRGHYFPFTEPSAEMDFFWTEGDCWLEWGGCGMIHPNVLANCGIDPERYQGFAFGMGLDRSAMNRFDIPNIHLMWDGDVRVLEQV